MISLDKLFGEKWDDRTRESLRRDLDAIEVAFNEKWSRVFTKNNQLKITAVSGGSSSGLSGRIPFSNIVQIAANVLLGRRNVDGAGDIEALTLNPTDVMVSTQLYDTGSLYSLWRLNGGL